MPLAAEIGADAIISSYYQSKMTDIVDKEHGNTYSYSQTIGSVSTSFNSEKYGVSIDRVKTIAIKFIDKENKEIPVKMSYDIIETTRKRIGKEFFLLRLFKAVFYIKQYPRATREDLKDLVKIKYNEATE